MKVESALDMSGFEDSDVDPSKPEIIPDYTGDQVIYIYIYIYHAHEIFHTHCKYSNFILLSSHRLVSLISVASLLVSQRSPPFPATHPL
jgi:hypothetical protein